MCQMTIDGFYIPKPENPMTDETSLSPLILPGAEKGANTMLLIAWVILFIVKSVNGFCFRTFL